MVQAVVNMANWRSSSNTGAAHDRSIINPVKGISDTETTGYGRIIRFHSPQTLGSIISRVNNGLGKLSGLSVAVPQSVPVGQKSDIKISSVGICAGSGGSMLNGLDVDLLFTGELSHHEALAAIEVGRCVITAFHSNTERAFLKSRMQPALVKELEALRKDAKSDDAGQVSGDFEVGVSEADKDPYEIVVPGQTGW
jgi:putative NIF3 family GTP cyclohydrolase 1 type 2